MSDVSHQQRSCNATPLLLIGEGFKTDTTPTSAFMENISPKDRDGMNCYLMIMRLPSGTVFQTTIWGFSKNHALKRAKMQAGEGINVYPLSED